MGKPAARKGDMHTCPMAEAGTPHVGGVIIGPGNGTVLIGGEPAAVVGDTCKCVSIGGPDQITGGSSVVLIGGKPAARVGDSCAHGGVVSGGCGSVLIGEGGSVNFSQGPSEEGKDEMISQTLKDCVVMLESKFQLLKNCDPKTLEEFNKWFGTVEDRARQTIEERIVKVLNVCKNLTVDNFKDFEFEKNKKSDYATVYPKDKSYRIFVGDQFWKLKAKGKRSKPGVLIHELSHFKNIGGTVDDTYGETDCKTLANDYPEDALKNADSFEFFIEE